MIGSDIAVCVRRRATAVVVDAFERQARRGNVQTRREGLDHRVAQQAVSLWTATKIAERNFLECAVAKHSAIGDTIERDAAGETEILD